MSNIALVSPATGTATFSITTPSGTSTDRTLTLPDNSGTVANSGISGVDSVPVGRGAGNVATNTAVGASALAANTTGDNITAVGSGAYALGTASANDAFGQNSMGGGIVTGVSNAAFGRNSLNALTSGTLNTAIGSASLEANTTGSNNTAVGRQALTSNTTASRNTAVGFASATATTTGFRNTGVGAYSLYVATTGNYNTAVGDVALESLTTGSFNTAIGIGSGGAITTGSKNTIIGGYSGNQGGLDIRTSSKNIVLSDGDGIPWVHIDSSGQALFDIYSVANAGTRILGPSTTGSPRIEVFHQSGSVSGGGFVVFALAGSVIGSITQSGTTAVAYNTTSDYRLKENVQPLTGALSRIAALKPCTYTWKSAPDETGEGFIAHELAEVCPLAVTGEKDAVNEDGSIKPQSIDTSFLVATLTAAIQELNAKVDAQAAEIAALKGQP